MVKHKRNKGKRTTNNLPFNLLNFNISHYYLFIITKYTNFIKDIFDLNDIKIKDEEIAIIKKEIEKCNQEKKVNENKISIEILPEFFQSINEIKKFELGNSDYALKIKYILDSLQKKKLNITLKKISKEYLSLYGNTISISTVSRILKNHLKMNYLRTCLKNPKLEEYNYIFMALSYIRIFYRSIKLGTNIIFLDETGFLLQNNNYHTWRINDEQIYAGPKSKQKERLNLILAISSKRVIHKEFRKDSVNSEIFLNFLEEIYDNLKQDEKTNSILIMDNATYHLTGEIINFFKDKKIKGLTICPYKSEFNMAELVFRYIKNIIYKNIYENMKDLEDDVTKILNSQKLEYSLINLYRETLQQYLIFSQNHNDLDLNKILK